MAANIKKANVGDKVNYSLQQGVCDFVYVCVCAWSHMYCWWTRRM